VFYCPAQPVGCQWNAGNPGQVVLAESIHTDFGYEAGERLLVASGNGATGTWFSYGLNIVGANWKQTPADPECRGTGFIRYSNTGPPPWQAIDQNLRKPTSVKASCEFILIADSTADGFADFELVPYIDSVPGYRRIIGDVHRGGANVLFLDGHVRWYLQKDVALKLPWVAREASKQRMWNFDNNPTGPW
jgi:prepilin-type processing-associated H-X9-DG protein